MKKKRVLLLGLVGATLAVGAAIATDPSASIRITSVEKTASSAVIATTVKNTGSSQHEFPVGCSLQRRDGSWLDVPYKLQPLAAGQSAVVVFRAEGERMDAFVLVRVAIWRAEKSDGTLDTRLDMDERSL